MKQFSTFVAMLKAEHFKSKRNIGLLLIIITPLLIVLAVDIYLVYRYNELTSMFSYNPWSMLLGRHTFDFLSLLYPTLVAIFSYSYWDMEAKNGGLKQLMTLPVNKKTVFSAKIVFIAEIVLLSILLAYFFFMLSGTIIGYALENYAFRNYNSRWIIFIFFAKMLISGLAVAYIQFFLSMVFKNFAIIGVACFGTFFSMIVWRWEYITFVPYSSLLNGIRGFSEGASSFGKQQYLDMGYIIIFILLSYFVFTHLSKGSKR